MLRVSTRQTARRDLVAHFAYLAEHAGSEVAERFLRNAEMSFSGLAHQPMMGMPLALRRPELVGMRKWRIKGFDNHLIFHQPKPEVISFVRVLHAASNWWGLLGLNDN